ncbi:AsnC family transcriptional regulator [Candidatus Woesearchaeota archaeon]|jgi:Lrp/AsnC family transcriptional regulator, leucine-responsive regulatory protein|nr:AsnC family transcriptional regulator [Candidatus Woesearchaeota archaeon]MBT6518979.1 AsnC family transcriptional regulator [Candidatus Woesearchaeota archaeon]MBT7368344.1 AsnC family transcriptional regulator [Candidatus Woesearchaeota archaeon]
MLHKLDLKDKKILFELDKNARISYAQIGKKIGLSTELVHYRVKRLEKTKILTKYQTAVNYSKLGLIHFKICLKYSGISLKIEEELYFRLKNIPQIVWIAKCQGEWDCILSCTANNLIELDLIKDKIITLANNYISQKSISISSKIWSFPRNYLINKNKETIFKMSGEQPKLDEIDLKLLKILSENSRKPVIKIVKEMNSTVKIITTRIKKLLKTGVINNFRLVIDYDKLGINFYKTFFYLKNPDEKKVQQLLRKLNIHPNVIHNLKVIGDWDLEPEFEFENKEEFQKTIQELMNEFSDTIQRISVINILKEYKYTFFHK